jgi:hypothetical protein
MGFNFNQKLILTRIIMFIYVNHCGLMFLLKFNAIFLSEIETRCSEMAAERS